MLPARVVDYNPQWLDELCLAGEVAWARLSLAEDDRRAAAASSPQRATPITLALRRDLGWLLETVRGDAAAGGSGDRRARPRRSTRCGSTARSSSTTSPPRRRQLPGELEEALWELVARGLVAGDGFQSLRQIMTPAGSARARVGAASQRATAARDCRARQRRRAAGRSSTASSPTPRRPTSWRRRSPSSCCARYGVVFRDLVARETFAVPWREVLRALRRMEARGDVRGGRFVAGFVGEQYALPEAVEACAASAARSAAARSSASTPPTR